MQKLTPLDYPKLKPFTRNQPYGLCYYSLPSILTWSNRFYQPYGVIDDDALIVGVEYTDTPADRHLILPLSPDRHFTPEALRDKAASLGFDKYRHVSEEYMARCGLEAIQSYFEVSEQVGYEDYIHAKQDLSQLKGNKYSKKRNLVNQFNREYVVKNRIQVEPITPAFLEECITFLYRQSEDMGRDIDAEEDLICEMEAIKEHVRHIDILETPGILLRIGDSVCAFGIGAHVTNEIGVLHYEKALGSVKGLYQYFDRLCANTLFDRYAYINRENDLGDPGLIKAKSSYHPVRRIKSFELRVKS